MTTSLRSVRNSLLAVALVATTGAPARAADSGKVKLPKGVDLNIPKGATKAGWAIFPPKKPRAAPELFTIDNQGRPWFGFKGRTIANPLAGHVYLLKEGFSDLAWMFYGGLLVGNGRSLGELAYDMVPPDEQGLRKFPAAINPWLQLPGPGYRVFSGEGCGLYLAGKDARSGKFSLLFLEIKSRHADVRSTPTRRLLDVETPIHWAAGDCERAYVAVGRVVTRIDLKAKKLDPLFTADPEQVRELAVTPRGIFYATDTGVGYFKDGFQVRFLKAPRPRIRARGDWLFILFQDGGLLRLEGLAGFEGWKKMSEARKRGK